MDAWDEFLLFVYGLPPLLVLGAMLLLRTITVLKGKPMPWGRAFMFGLLALPLTLILLVLYSLLK